MVAIQHTPYTLQSKEAIQQERQGVLLRVTFADGTTGYTDCHLWPELGDPSIEELLQQLEKRDYDHPLFPKIFAKAKIDQTYRDHGLSFDVEGNRLKNHALFSDVRALTEESLGELAAEGFTHIKLKVGRDVASEVKTLTQYFGKGSPFALRLDFNARVDRETYQKVVSQLSDAGVAIEFSEDPYPYNYTEWLETQEQTGVLIAVDRYAVECITNEGCPFTVIIKPAVDDIAHFEQYLEGKKYVVTSYLDHPVGQVSAAYYAHYLQQRYPQESACHGLLSHHVYTPTAYSAQLTQVGPWFNFPKGGGVGFNELLNEELWID